jgi:hypothetical protein
VAAPAPWLVKVFLVTFFSKKVTAFYDSLRRQFGAAAGVISEAD